MKRLAFVLFAACAGQPVDEQILRDMPINDYPSWKQFTTSGETPGHGDSIRDIYFNPTAELFSGGLYDQGTIIVKEVYGNDGGERGSLRVIEVMRRAIPLAGGTDRHDERLGWVFSAKSTRDGDEADVSDFCWRRCHQSAPIAGAWFDYYVIANTPEM